MSIKRTRRKTTIRSGSRSVTVSNTLTIQAEQITRDVPEDLRRFLGSEINRWRSDIAASWPRKTGRSAESMSVMPPTIVSGRIVAQIYNDAERPSDGARYAYDIRVNGERVWETDVVQRLESETEGLASRMMEDFMRRTRVN